MNIAQTLLAVVAGSAGAALIYGLTVIVSLEISSWTRHGRHRLVYRPANNETFQNLVQLQAAAVQHAMGHATSSPEVQPVRPVITYSPVCWGACGRPEVGYDHASWCMNYERKK